MTPTDDPDRRRLLLRTAAVALGGWGGLGAHPVAWADGGSTWPARPVTLIVPFPPGGGSDAFAQPLAARLSQTLGTPFVIEHKAGAGGTVGAALAARAPADGHTLLLGAVHHAIAAVVQPKLDYDIQRDFAAIGLLANVPQVVVVSAQHSPVSDLKALLAAVRASPGSFSYASAGNGTSQHLAGELFKLQTGTVINHRPYLGAGPALQDLMAGKVDMMFDSLASSAAHIRAGRLKALAVASDKRVPAFADLPTAAEFNLREFRVTTWYGLWAPKGTPPGVAERMQHELRGALRAAELAATWRGLGSTTPHLYGEGFGRFVDAEIRRWGAVVKAAGLKLS